MTVGPPARQRAAIFFLNVRSAQLGADPVGGGVDEAVELVGGRGAGLHRPCSSHPQLAERLDRTGAGLRGRRWPRRRAPPARGFGVDGVGLAAPGDGSGGSAGSPPRPARHEQLGSGRVPRPTSRTPRRRPRRARRSCPTRRADAGSRAVEGNDRCAPGSGRGRRSPPRTWTSLWVSTPPRTLHSPVTARWWSCHSFHQLGDGWHAPPGGRTGQ